MNDAPVWDDGDWQGLPSLEESAEVDLCVVGLGGSGLAAVDEALRAGKKVMGIDAGQVAGEAAGRNGGFLIGGMNVAFHDALARWGAETAKRVHQATLDELRDLLAQPTGRQVGSLRIADNEEELVDVVAEYQALRSNGFDADEYDGPEGKGILFPGDGVCDPMQRCRALVPGLLDDGAMLFEHTRAVSVESHRITTESAVIEADRVVVAVDGRIEALFPELSGRARTAKLEMLATEPLPPRFSRPVYTAYGFIYWQQLPDGRIALGGLRDRFAEHSWSLTSGPTPELQNALDGYLIELDVRAAVTHRWAGHAAYTPDRSPIYEEIRPDVWVVGGYCGHGNVFGSVYGRAAVRSAVTGSKEELL